MAIEMKKQLSLEKQIEIIMRHYFFDPYNKSRYIADCSKAIEKVVLEMIGEDETFPNVYVPEFIKEAGQNLVNDTKQEIRERILGE